MFISILLAIILHSFSIKKRNNVLELKYGLIGIDWYIRTGDQSTIGRPDFELSPGWAIPQ